MFLGCNNIATEAVIEIAVECCVSNSISISEILSRPYCVLMIFHICLCNYVTVFFISLH